MRTAAVLLALFLSGCGGYVMVASHTDEPVPPSRAVPMTYENCTGLCPQEAIAVAVTEAHRHDCSNLMVEKVRCDKNSCKVEMRGELGRRRDARIQVKVDRRTGKVRSYKCKVHDDDNED